MTPTYLVLGCILSYCLHLGHTFSSSHLCKDTGCFTHFTNKGVEAKCVNVLHANWTEIGEKYDLSTVMEDGLCDGACCRCLTRRQHKCTDVTGSCRAAFRGAGSCIDARTGDLSNIDTQVKPRGGLCGAGSDKCCECFKLKTEDLTTTTTTTTTTLNTTTTSTTKTTTTITTITTISTTITTTTTKNIITTTTSYIRGSIIAIGGYNGTRISSVEVLSTSCDLPLPEGRSGHVSVNTSDSKTLVCGGHTSSGVTASCLQFNFQSKTWEHHSNMMNKYRHSSSAIALKHGVYILGGYSVSSRSSSEFLATGSSNWTPGPNIPGGGVWHSCAVKLSDTEFVILGGYNDRTQARVYSTTKNEWTEWTKLSEGVYGQSCVRIGEKIVMAGGRDSSYRTIRRTVIIDIKTGSAREVASLKYPRSWAAMETYGGKPVILGGTNGSVYRTDAEMWNMDTETWEEADISLNIARYKFSLVATDEEIQC